MSDQRPRFLDEPRNGNRVFWTLLGVCVLLVVIDLFLHRHVYFGVEGIPGFYAAFGFVAFVLIVLAGKHLRRILMREEDYYDR